MASRGERLAPLCIPQVFNAWLGILSPEQNKAGLLDCLKKKSTQMLWLYKSGHMSKSSIIKRRGYDKLPNLPYKHQQWFIYNYSSSHLGCFPASGSSVGLAYALNQALSLPIVSVTVAVLTLWRSSSAFAFRHRRETAQTKRSALHMIQPKWAEGTLRKEG